jgi:hypothetical protein
LKPITDDVLDSPEAIAATIAAADRRLAELTREVERYLASRAPAQRPTAAPAPPRPAVSVAASAHPEATRSLAASFSRLTRGWWPR